MANISNEGQDHSPLINNQSDKSNSIKFEVAGKMLSEEEHLAMMTDIFPDNPQLIEAYKKKIAKITQLEKFDYFNEFCTELQPIVELLNGLLSRYQITNVKDFILFRIKDNLVSPFMDYSAFPCLQMLNNPPEK